MSNIEKQYSKFDDAVELLKNSLNVSTVSALTETFDNLENKKIKVENGAPDKETVQKLAELYKTINYEKLTSAQRVNLFTLMTLKALTQDGKDYNLMPTPPIIATIIALLWKHLITSDKLTIVDPAIGTGTLLFTLVKELMQNNHSKGQYSLYGIDNDESVLDLADINAHLNNLKIELFRQDAMDPWMIKESDVVVSDLPVGFYPLDDNIKDFATRSDEGHSLAHELYIEQIIKNLRADGFAFLLVPNSLLNGEVGKKFMPWLAKKVYLRDLVELPTNLFSSQMNQKSLLVFQNHGTSQASKVLITKIGSLKDEKSLVKFNVELNEWYTNLSRY